MPNSRDTFSIFGDVVLSRESMAAVHAQSACEGPYSRYCRTSECSPVKSLRRLIDAIASNIPSVSDCHQTAPAATILFTYKQLLGMKADRKVFNVWPND